MVTQIRRLDMNASPANFCGTDRKLALDVFHEFWQIIVEVEMIPRGTPRMENSAVVRSDQAAMFSSATMMSLSATNAWIGHDTVTSGGRL